jgi:hypothetical protein
VIFKDKIPSNELGELGIDIGKQVTPISKRVKTSQLFFNSSTWLVDGVGVGVLVTDGVIELVGVTVGVLVLVGVVVGVGVFVGVGQLTDATIFSFTTPLDGFV